MGTDQLIALIAADNDKVAPVALHRITWAVAIAALVACGLMVSITIGKRGDLANASTTFPVLAKVILGTCIAGLALIAFQRSLRPGVKPGWPALLLSAPMVVLACLAFLALSQAPAESRGAMIFGRNWLVCLVAVPLYALLPLAGFVVVARRGAPVDEVSTGIFAGLAAAGLSTIAYSLHCSDDTMPFLATWYSLAMAIEAGLGAFAFPRLVRW